jgi:response regulator NasT
MFLSAFSDDATVAQVKALGAVAYLVKPLDIGQIVPTVEAAFARLPTAEPAPAAPAAAESPPDPVWIAVGVLMHRYSLTRGEALARLIAQATNEQRALRAQAERLVEAVELLAGSGRPS